MKAFLVALMLLAVPARAETPQVSIQVEVVQASMKGESVDPSSLEAVKAKLARKARYTSLRRLSLETVTTPVQLKLPNQKVASISLEELKDGVARLKVIVPPLSTVYVLGQEGTLYQAAGKMGDDDLWLLLSAAR